MATYSVGFGGIRADGGPTKNASTILADDFAQPGGQQLAMSQGVNFLCKGPDGQQRLYRIDAERSLPGGPVYLLAV